MATNSASASLLERGDEEVAQQPRREVAGELQRDHRQREDQRQEGQHRGGDRAEDRAGGVGAAVEPDHGAGPDRDAVVELERQNASAPSPGAEPHAPAPARGSPGGGRSSRRSRARTTAHASGTRRTVCGNGSEAFTLRSLDRRRRAILRLAELGTLHPRVPKRAPGPASEAAARRDLHMQPHRLHGGTKRNEAQAPRRPPDRPGARRGGDDRQRHRPPRHRQGEAPEGRGARRR